MDYKKTLEVDIWGIYTHDIYIYFKKYLYYKWVLVLVRNLVFFFTRILQSHLQLPRCFQAVHKTPGGEALTPQQLKVQEEFVRRATRAAKSQGQKNPGIP